MRPSAHLLPARCSKRRSSRFHGETHNAKARLCCRLNSGDVGHWLYPGHHLRLAWLGPVVTSCSSMEAILLLGTRLCSSVSSARSRTSATTLSMSSSRSKPLRMSGFASLAIQSSFPDKQLCSRLRWIRTNDSNFREHHLPDVK